jgi:alpha-galactosidase
MLIFDGSVLTASSPGIHRRWRLGDGVLHALELRDPRSGRAWIRPSDAPALAPPSGCGSAPWSVTWATDAVAPPWEGPAERGVLAVIGADGRGWRLHLTLPEAAPALTCRLELVGATAVTSGEAGHAEGSSGIETDGSAVGSLPALDLCERLTLATRHTDLLAVDLLDQSDVRGTPVQERRWRTYPNERIVATAAIVALEDTASGAGLVLVRHAPPPHARRWHAGPDVIAWRGELCLRGHGCGSTSQGWAWSVVVHEDGAHGRAAALHALSRARRRRVPGREGRLITNTWGDRNKDGRIGEPFLIAEAAAAAALGADAMQIDAGWQQGIDSNSVANTGQGVWQGFWAADPDFWTVHRQRLPHGLAPIAAAARAHGIDLGLWFAPDSSGDLANWQRDAEVHRRLGAEHGIAHWKFDALKLHNRAAELRFSQLIEALWRGSDGRAWLDLDITAEDRPGFLGADPLGCLFVQNRYTDWANWWPHETLRTLWELAWWVPPQRLRVEFLNPARNRARYGDDPLAPARYPLDWPLATTLVANPLGWFEASGLEADFRSAVAALVSTWKGQRDGLHGGTILPIGARPGGAATCGFISLGADGAHLLVFREPLAPAAPSQLVLPAAAPPGPWRRIAGSGTLTAESGGVRVADLASPGWGWWRCG